MDGTLEPLGGLVNDRRRITTRVNGPGLRHHWPFESVVIWQRGDWGSVVSHHRRERKRSIHYRWRYPWWLVAVVIPSSIRVITSVNYRGDKEH